MANHSGTWVGMGSEQGPAWARRLEEHLPLVWGDCLECERCGGVLYPGDWPFCKGKPSDHSR